MKILLLVLAALAPWDASFAAGSAPRTMRATAVVSPRTPLATPQVPPLSPAAPSAPGAPSPPLDPAEAMGGHPLATTGVSEVVGSPALDLASLPSPVLLKLARALDRRADRIWFDPDQQEALRTAGPDAPSTAATDLFAELKRRAGRGDRLAKQALDLAIQLHRDPRALPVNGGLAPSSPTAQALSPSSRP